MPNIIAKDFFIYQLNFGSLAAGASLTGNFTIDADSDFRLEKLTYFSEIAGGAQTDSTRVIPLVTALITDSGSGRQLSNIAVPISNVFGTGEIPFILGTPRILAARSNITVTIANFSASTTYSSIRLSFIGTKLYKGA